MENNLSAVDWLQKLYENRPESILIDEDFSIAKEKQKEQAFTFAIMAISNCCSVVDGQISVNKLKIENLLNERYG
jgi:hypothetical protein